MFVMIFIFSAWRDHRVTCFHFCTRYPCRRSQHLKLNKFIFTVSMQMMKFKRWLITKDQRYTIIFSRILIAIHLPIIFVRIFILNCNLRSIRTFQVILPTKQCRRIDFLMRKLTISGKLSVSDQKNSQITI